VLVLALGVRLLNLWHTAGLPIASYQFDWPESDMTANFVWSGRILRGDVLGRDGVHPSTGWMRDIAPQSTWQRWWGGNAVFQQAPLYAYTLAGIRWLAGDSFLGIGLVQALLGTLNVGLVFLLARHLFDPPAPAIAALLFPPIAAPAAVPTIAPTAALLTVVLFAASSAACAPLCT